MPKISRKPDGLRLSGNDTTQDPGAMRTAQNGVVIAPGKIESRLGFSRLHAKSSYFPLALVYFRSKVLAVGTTITAGKVGLLLENGTEIDVQNTRMTAPIENDGNGAAVVVGEGADAVLYGSPATFTDVAGEARCGVWRLASVLGTNASHAGFSFPVLDVFDVATPGPHKQNTYAAYRVCIVRHTENGDVRSPPSNVYIPMVDPTGDRKYTFRVELPPETETGDYVELYRTRAVPCTVAVTGHWDEPSDAHDGIYRLVNQKKITNVASGFVTIEDAQTAPGIPLYTNVHEPDNQYNFKPPRCVSMALYKNCLFFGGCEHPRTQTLVIQKVAGTVPAEVSAGVDTWDGSGGFTPTAGTVVGGDDNSIDAVSGFDNDGDGVPDGLGVYKMVCTTNVGSNVVGVPDKTPLRIGMLVTDNNILSAGTIPVDTYIIAFGAGSAVTLSQNATATGTFTLNFRSVVQVGGKKFVADTQQSRPSPPLGTDYEVFNANGSPESPSERGSTAAWRNYCTAVSLASAITRKFMGSTSTGNDATNGQLIAVATGDPTNPGSAHGEITVFTATPRISSAGFDVKVHNEAISVHHSGTDQFVTFPYNRGDDSEDPVDDSKRGLFWSKRGEYEHVPLGNSRQFEDPIVHLAATLDTLYVFTERGVYACSGEGPLSGFTFQQVVSPDAQELRVYGRPAAYENRLYAVTSAGIGFFENGVYVPIDADIYEYLRDNYLSTPTGIGGIVGVSHQSQYVAFSLGTVDTFGSGGEGGTPGVHNNGEIFVYSLRSQRWSTMVLPTYRDTSSFLVHDYRSHPTCFGSDGRRLLVGVYHGVPSAQTAWVLVEKGRLEAEAYHDFVENVAVTVTGGISVTLPAGVSAAVGDWFEDGSDKYVVTAEDGNDPQTVTVHAVGLSNDTYELHHGIHCQWLFDPIYPEPGSYMMWQDAVFSFRTWPSLAYLVQNDYVTADETWYEPGVAEYLTNGPRFRRFFIPAEAAHRSELAVGLSFVVHYGWARLEDVTMSFVPGQGGLGLV